MSLPLPPEIWEIILEKLISGENGHAPLQCRLVSSAWMNLINNILRNKGTLLYESPRIWSQVHLRQKCPSKIVKYLTTRQASLGSIKTTCSTDLIKFGNEVDKIIEMLPEYNPFPSGSLILNCTVETNNTNNLCDLTVMEKWGYHALHFVYIPCSEMLETREELQALLNHLPNLKSLTIYAYTWWKPGKCEEVTPGHDGSNISDWLRVAGIAAQTMKMKCHQFSENGENGDQNSIERVRSLSNFQMCDIGQQILFTLELGVQHYLWQLTKLSLKFISVEGTLPISWNKFTWLLQSIKTTLQYLQIIANPRDFSFINNTDEPNVPSNEHDECKFSFLKLTYFSTSKAFCSKNSAVVVSSSILNLLRVFGT